ncbi:MAG: hypothetical protein R6W70_03340 [bacterium]
MKDLLIMGFFGILFVMFSFLFYIFTITKKTESPSSGKPDKA